MSTTSHQPRYAIRREPPPLKPRPLPLRLIGFLIFILVFLRELISANLSLANAALFVKKSDFDPGFFLYPLENLSEFEILLLTHTITLTPGTTSVMVDEEAEALIVHAFDAHDEDELVQGIHSSLERAILGFTR